VPAIHDPEFGASYSYQARRNSLIRISHHRLPPLNIHVELLFPRWLLFLPSSSIAWLCSLAVIHAAQNPLRTRRRTLVIPILPGGAARLRIQRVDWSDVTRFLLGPPPVGYTHEDALLGVFSIFLLNPKVLTQIACPARGPQAKDQRLYDLLPGVLFACRELVVKAQEDKKLQRQIRQIIEEDSLAFEYIKRYTLNDAKGAKARAVALAARALRSPGLPKSADLLRDYPETVLKNWLYPKKKSAGGRRLLKLVLQHAPDLYPWDTWARLYLGQPGDAARAFCLIAD
jgi:hypothetical protein